MRRNKLFIAAIGAALLVLLLLLLFRRAEEPAPPRATHTPDAESLRDGDCFAYHDETPLPGRPANPISICRDIYDHVELDLDGKRVGSLIRLKAGSTVAVSGTIFANEALDPRVSLDGGLALVSRANNRVGWTVRSSQFSKSHFGQGRCTFQVQYVVRDEPGEYLVVVVSSAVIGHVDHPILIAAQYPAVVE